MIRTLQRSLVALWLVACAGADDLTLTVEDPTNGSIALDPAGGVYEEGTVVTVTATPDAGYAFDGWTGDLTGATSPATLTMDGDKTVGATFVQAMFTLTVSPADNGTITLDPAGGSYAAGTEVTVTATPDAGYALAAWTGALSGRASPTMLVVDADVTIGATFEEGVLVEIPAAANGAVTVEPSVTSGQTVPWGTALTITAEPDAGYAIDALFKMLWVIEPYWAYYVDEEFSSPHTVVLDPADARFKVFGGELDKLVVGAYFVPDDTWPALDETLNVVYAQPGSKELKYDVYAPPDADSLPVVVIIHGGGWSSNTEDIMRGQARTIAATGRYVVASIDYRLTSDLDTPPPTLVDLVEDVFGAVAHIREHAASYGGDPDQLAVTGDSAGGHLAAVVTLMSDRIGDGGYDGTVSSEFVPTYVPAGATLDEVRDGMTAAIKASAPSYGVFASDGWDAAISPMSDIPDVAERVLPPQHCQVGSVDVVVSPADVQAYVAALTAAGQDAEYVEIAGANHAYFDWKPDAPTQATFEAVGRPALDQMIAFFDGVFYP